MSEIRLNQITGDWVIIAPERGKRPTDFAAKETHAPLQEHSPSCPFCPGNETMVTEERFRITDRDGKWLVKSIQNKFSVLSAHEKMDRLYTGFKNRLAGFGFHEVIVETPRHDLTTALLPLSQVQNILIAYRQRFHDFFTHPSINHAIIFKNHGSGAGTSLAHPHSQIVGLPVVPGQIRARLENAKHFHEEYKECLFCWTLKEELKEKSRIVMENGSFVAFIPYAALSTFHVWIFPRRHSPSFGSAGEQEIEDLANILRTILGKLYTVLRNPDFNYVIRTAPPSGGASDFFHWYLAIIPRLSKAAGFELGTGMYVNPSDPIDSASVLRESSFPAVE